MSRMDDRTLALLSGYAAGILTPEEHRSLMDAALRDQAVFDALAGEEALRELLADGATRSRLAAALAPARPAWYRRPWAWGALAAPVMAGLALLLMMPGLPPPEPLLMARAERERLVEPPPRAPQYSAAMDNAAPGRALQKSASAKLPAAASEIPTPASLRSQPAAAAVIADEKKELAADVLTAQPVAKSVAALGSAESDLNSARRNEPRMAAQLPPPAPAAEAIAPMGFRQREEGDIRSPQTARKSAAPELEVTILTRARADAEWTALESGTVPAGASLRLRIRTAQPGVLRVLPGNGNLVSLNRPADPLEIDLEAQPTGNLNLNVVFYPRRAGEARGAAATASALQTTLNESPATQPPVTFSRRLTVR